MTPGEMLKMLSSIWIACTEYPDVEHEEILRHIEGLQMIIFRFWG